MATRKRRWPDPDAERRWTRSYTAGQQEQQVFANPPAQDQHPASRVVASDLGQPVNQQATELSQAPSSELQDPGRGDPGINTSTSTGGGKPNHQSIKSLKAYRSDIGLSR